MAFSEDTSKSSVFPAELGKAILEKRERRLCTHMIYKIVSI